MIELFLRTLAVGPRIFEERSISPSLVSSEKEMATSISGVGNGKGTKIAV